MTEQLRKDRAAAGRIGGLTRAARETDTERKSSAQRGQRGLSARFERQVPDTVTDPAERARMAQMALRAHMAGLAHSSAKKRRERLGARNAA